ncbi:hypothetical protein [Streptomyces poriferorum]|uniref:hypothetical protein n=1 Tax=Streptomyces poriferorum TaxID=2798799 RepID=UPI0035323017
MECCRSDGQTRRWMPYRTDPGGAPTKAVSQYTSGNLLRLRRSGARHATAPVRRSCPGAVISSSRPERGAAVVVPGRTGHRCGDAVGPPTRVLQPSSEKMRKDAHVGYVVAFDPKGIRWSHSDPSRIGGHVTGGFGPALTGKPFQETFDSALGRAVDTTVAVFDARGRVVGLISVGIYVKSVNEMVSHQLPAILAVAGGALLLAAAGQRQCGHSARHHRAA